MIVNTYMLLDCRWSCWTWMFAWFSIASIDVEGQQIDEEISVTCLEDVSFANMIFEFAVWRNLQDMVVVEYDNG